MTSSLPATALPERARQDTRWRTPLFDFQRTLTWRGRVALGVLAWVLFVSAWQMLARAGIAPEQLFPAPTDVFGALYRLLTEQQFLGDIRASLTRILISFAIAASIAVPLGVLMGAFPVVAAFGNALVSPFRYLPAPSFIPLLLMWLGTGEAQKIALLCLGVVWFLITLIMDNTRAVRVDLIETAKTLGATRRATLWTVVVPAALPAIVDTLRQMLAVSWTYLVIAEIVAATDGIGAMMMRARRFVRVDDIMAGILVIGLLGLLLDLLFRALHWWVFPYLRRRRQ
ncbi:Taurine transport system permease protein tauC [Isoalcanivorax pacificus W11-5]|uniref:Taurine transport system permease protein tauC n=1 Tax=Isoalcanivorax pacificus W11-5 TaxID=391936 RepID=A0A0B4XSR4_9GAMM|nr:ABC transporter permease [Isoalcanivorax pacificus]AJD49443.1 Taurine transport system permease protein tauC [Isoalcanivorax pacificus W11-5]